MEFSKVFFRLRSNRKMTKEDASLKKLWNHLTNHRKKQFFMLIILMFVASTLEVVSVGAILPFLGALTAPDQVFQHHLMQPLINVLELSTPDQLILPLTVLFISAAILAGSIRLLLLYAVTRLSYATGADLSIKIYNLTLYQEYAIHVSRNSSEVINGIIAKTTTVIGSVIMPIVNLISSTILIISIMLALFIIDTTVALSAFIGFGLLYYGIIRFTGIQLKEIVRLLLSNPLR